MRSRSAILLRFLGGALLSVAVPVALAWLAMTVLHRRVYATDVRNLTAEKTHYGRVRLRVKLPGTHEAVPEPLVSAGLPGRATLVFIRLLPNARARIGVEFWGFQLLQGPEFDLPAADAEIEVVCYMPAFFPREGDPAWGAISPGIQRIRNHEYRVLVDGVTRLQGPLDYETPEDSPIFFGTNPLGGSFVYARFSGTLLQADQRF